MWYYRRLFASLLACGLLLGSVFFLRIRLDRRPLAPQFLPNVPRFRTARVCSGRALVLVSSSPAHAQRRQAIRETWAHPSVTEALDMSVAFGMGPADTADSQRAVDWEAEIYGDLFQDGGFLQILKSARGACSPLPEFVLKVDDDVFVNTHSLADFLGNIETFSSSSTMWCLEWNRKLDSIGGDATWIAQSSTSGGSIRPAYCLTALYLMTGRALDAVIRRHESKNPQSRFQLPDDVYVTTVLAREGRLSLMVLGDRSVFDPRVEEVDPAKITLARLGGRAVEAETKKLWATLVGETLNYSRRYDVGL